MALFGHLIDLVNIIFVISISMINAEGEEVETTWYFLDTTTPRDCPSNVGCFFPEDNTIWIRIDKIDRTDKCGRNVILHELMHIKYLGQKIHDDCSLNESMYITRVSLVDIWSTTS